MHLILLALAVTIPFLVVIVHLVRQRKLRAKYSFLWLMVAAVLMVLVLVPGILDQIGEAFGVAYPPALLFLGAIVFLLFVAVHFSWELSRIEDRQRTLAEELALANSRIAELESSTAHEARELTDSPR